MLKHATIFTMALAIIGCDISGLGKSVQTEFDLPKPTAWMIRDGQRINIDDEVVEIVGTDQCNTGFGDTYSCWIFSLEPGAKTPVILSNGVHEVWATQDAGDGRVNLVRPGGSLVSAVE